MNRTALVTGSSRGIGKAIALRLAQDGYQVVLHGSQASEELKAVEKELKATGTKIVTTHFDVSDNAAVTAACAELLEKVKVVDVLVNNAGITRDKTLLKMSLEDWDTVMKTNLYAPFYLIQQLLPAMKEQAYGRIINMSSIVALKGNFGQTNYAAAKAGLIGLTKALTRETGKYNVTVNAICPGLIDTAMTSKIPPEYMEHLLSQVVLGRQGDPKEVASMVSYLASEESSYVTGAVMNVNGGWL